MRIIKNLFITVFCICSILSCACAQDSAEIIGRTILQKYTSKVTAYSADATLRNLAVKLVNESDKLVWTDLHMLELLRAIKSKKRNTRRSARTGMRSFCISWINPFWIVGGRRVLRELGSDPFYQTICEESEEEAYKMLANYRAHLRSKNRSSALRDEVSILRSERSRPIIEEPSREIPLSLPMEDWDPQQEEYRRKEAERVRQKELREELILRANGLAFEVENAKYSSVASYGDMAAEADRLERDADEIGETDASSRFGRAAWQLRSLERDSRSSDTRSSYDSLRQEIQGGADSMSW